MYSKKLNNQFKTLYINSSRIKKCFCYDELECKGKIKQAHSIQKNGKISLLESEINGNKCLFTFKELTMSGPLKIDSLEAIGKKEATTFYGFCDYHDSKVFSKIENFDYDFSDEQSFLHSYRAFAYSYHVKKEEIKAWNDPEYSQFLIKAYGESNVIIKRKQFSALEKSLEDRKEKLNTALRLKKFDTLNYLYFKFDHIAPIAVSSLITPIVSYKNIKMNNFDYENLLVSQPMMTLIPEKNGSVLIMAAFNDDEISSNYLDDLHDFKIYELEKAISSIIIESCENTVINPYFWNKLSDYERKLILDEYSYYSLKNQTKNKIFWSKFNFFKDQYKINSST